jgi:hypothetical protein
MEENVKPNSVNWAKVSASINESILSEENAENMEQNRKYIWCMKLEIGEDLIKTVYRPFYESLKGTVI